jgi:hypothetical protein
VQPSLCREDTRPLAGEEKDSDRTAAIEAVGRRGF